LKIREEGSKTKTIEARGLIVLLPYLMLIITERLTPEDHFQSKISSSHVSFHRYADCVAKQQQRHPTD
jgi:hypothetical protein